jgi:hypothetical protein
MRALPALAFFMVVAVVPAPAAAGGPTMVHCLRDPAQDPAQIRALFDRLDKGPLEETAATRFILEDQDYVPSDEFRVHDLLPRGSKPSKGLKVTRMRALAMPGDTPQRFAWVVSTRRSQWFDYSNSYEDVNDVWLVTFSGCEIGRVREVPELSYLVDGSGADEAGEARQAP